MRSVVLGYLIYKLVATHVLIEKYEWRSQNDYTLVIFYRMVPHDAQPLFP